MLDIISTLVSVKLEHVTVLHIIANRQMSLQHVSLLMSLLPCITRDRNRSDGRLINLTLNHIKGLIRRELT